MMRWNDMKLAALLVLAAVLACTVRPAYPATATGNVVFHKYTSGRYMVWPGKLFIGPDDPQARESDLWFDTSPGGSSEWIDSSDTAFNGSITAAAAAAVAENKSLHITGMVTVSAAVDLSAVPEVDVIAGGGFTSANGSTLTPPRNFHAGFTQVFFGNVAVTGIATGIPEWWGAVGNGSTYDTPALAAAVAAVDEIYLSRDYKVTYLYFARPVRFSGPGRIMSTDVNKHILGYLEGAGEGILVTGGSFGPMPSGADDFAAIYMETAKRPRVMFTNMTTPNTGIRFGYTSTDRTSDGFALGNHIHGAQQMGVEVMNSLYHRIIGNAMESGGVANGSHGVRLSGTESPVKGAIVGLNSIRDKRNGVSYQLGAENSIAVGNYVENGLYGYEDTATGPIGGRHVIASTIVKDSRDDAFSLIHGQGYRVDGMVDGADDQGILTDVGGTDGKHRIDLSIFDTDGTALNLRNNKNLAVVLIDGTTAGTPASIAGDNNLVLVLVTGTSLTNTVYVTGNNNTIIISESGTGTTALRVDGDSNHISGRVTGTTSLNGDDNVVDLIGSTLTIGSGADGNKVSGKFSVAVVDNGTASDISGIYGYGPATILSATSTSLGGSALTTGDCSTQDVNVAGATDGMAVVTSPTAYPGDGAVWTGRIFSAGVVRIKVCALYNMTPTATTYNIRVMP